MTNVPYQVSPAKACICFCGTSQDAIARMLGLLLDDEDAAQFFEMELPAPVIMTYGDEKNCRIEPNGDMVSFDDLDPDDTRPILFSGGWGILESFDFVYAPNTVPQDAIEWMRGQIDVALYFAAGRIENVSTKDVARFGLRAARAGALILCKGVDEVPQTPEGAMDLAAAQRFGQILTADFSDDASVYDAMAEIGTSVDLAYSGRAEKRTAGDAQLSPVVTMWDKMSKDQDLARADTYKMLVRKMISHMESSPEFDWMRK